jgi:hypothetical protein
LKWKEEVRGGRKRRRCAERGGGKHSSVVMEKSTIWGQKLITEL